MKTLITKDICTPVFIPVLFTMAKNGSNLKKVRTDRWMDEEDVVYIHNGILHALQNLTIFKNNGGPGGYCAKTQNDREWQMLYDHLEVESKKQNKWTKIAVQKQSYKDEKQTGGCQNGQEGKE